MVQGWGALAEAKWSTRQAPGLARPSLASCKAGGQTLQATGGGRELSTDPCPSCCLGERDTVLLAWSTGRTVAVAGLCHPHSQCTHVAPSRTPRGRGCGQATLSSAEDGPGLQGRAGALGWFCWPQAPQEGEGGDGQKPGSPSTGHWRGEGKTPEVGAGTWGSAEPDLRSLLFPDSRSVTSLLASGVLILERRVFFC